MTRRALLFGEALIDSFPDRRVVAGAPLHVAVHFARRGWEACLVSRVGDDGDGTRIRGVLRKHGVDASLVETDPVLPTGTVTVELEPGGLAHTFTIHRPAAWDAISGPEAWPTHEVLVFGSLAAREWRSRSALLSLLAEPASLRVFDVNLRPPDVCGDVLRQGLRSAHLVKVNEGELAAVGRALELGPVPSSWFDSNPGLRWLCITRGPDGAELHARDGSSKRVPGADVEVVDTVGAGDAFTAGLVDALTRGLPADRALASGRELAAGVLGMRGGLPGADG